MNPTVSIALCTCNGGHFIATQLESLAAQTRPPDEVIVSDDASTDDTLAVVEEVMQRTGLQGRILRNSERLGFSRNFEQAVRQCRGDLIFFCDQDDFWYPEKIGRYLEAFSVNPGAALVASDSELVDEQLRPLNRRFLANVHFHRRFRRRLADDAFLVFLAMRPLPGHAMALHRSVCERMLPVPEGWHYDTWGALIAAVEGGVVLLDEALVKYRRHANQTAGTFDTTPMQMARALGPGTPDVFGRQIPLFEALRERLTDPRLDPPPNLERRLAQIDEKIRFLMSRAGMKQRPGGRWRLIVEELLTGRYFSVGQGWLSLARDVLGK